MAIIASSQKLQSYPAQNKANYYIEFANTSIHSFENNFIKVRITY